MECVEHNNALPSDNFYQATRAKSARGGKEPKS
jgi:hypothetical protein